MYKKICGMNVKKFRIKFHIQFDLIVNIKIYNTHIVDIYLCVC